MFRENIIARTGEAYHLCRSSGLQQVETDDTAYHSDSPQ